VEANGRRGWKIGRFLTLAALMRQYPGINMQFDNILFPVDFSEQCLQVSRAVNAMAHAFNSRITLLNVLTLPPQFYDSSDRSLVYGEVTLEDVRNSCKERLQSSGLAT
jgi:hypothetical protein